MWWLAGIGIVLVFVYLTTTWMTDDKHEPESGCGCLRCMRKNREKWEREHK